MQRTPIIFVIMAIAVYLGIGGLGRVIYKDQIETLMEKKPEITDTTTVSINGITYRNMLEMKRGEKLGESEHFNRIFYLGPDTIPDLISLLLTACCFSLIGTITQLLWLKNQNPDAQITGSFSGSMILGFLTGFFVIALTYVIPSALIKNDATQIRPISLMFVSLFAGFSFNRFYQSITAYFEDLFQPKKS